jgi:hypothetical protein
MDLSFEFPSWEPEPNETVVPEAAAFLDACQRMIAYRVDKGGWILGDSTLTHSDRWGLVWRVDFTRKRDLPDQSSDNRLICWGTPDGECLGTAVTAGWRWAARFDAK